MSETAHGIPPGAADELVLNVGGVQIRGWQSVHVSRPLNAIPASFDIQITEKYPDSPDVAVKPGDECSVTIGGDLVLTGYVDQYAVTINAGNHTVKITGRSKSQDLVDCSALFDTQSGQPGMQKMAGTTLSIAQALAAPYHVTVKSNAGDGVNVPQLNINLGETAWDIIDRVMRYSQFVAYDLPDGTLMLSQAGTEKMASGFKLGDNVEHASVAFSMNERFSDYEAHFISSFAFGSDVGPNQPTIGEVIKDAGVPRFRKRYIVSEQFQDGEALAAKRALWECNYRKAHSQQVSITCDAWRDSAGALWAPNHLAPIDAAPLKVDPDQPWLLGSVTYIRDENGQHADLVLMPKDAYVPEPVALNQLPPTIDQIEKSKSGANNPTAPEPKTPTPVPASFETVTV